MARIFISYRRADSAYVTGILAEKLRVQFGLDAVFLDVDAIPLGEDFAAFIASALAESDVALVVIGDDWLSAPARGGGRRIDNPADLVRIEIELALASDAAVVPVLVGATGMPVADSLPVSLRGLVHRNAAELRAGADFRPHLQRLVDGVGALVAEAATRRVESQRATLQGVLGAGFGSLSPSLDAQDPESEMSIAEGASSRPPRLALVIAWSRSEPSRVGEVFPIPRRPGPAMLGREYEGAGPETILARRERPGELSAGAGLASAKVSRRQLMINREPGGVRVRNIGRAVLRVHGEETQDAVLIPGDELQLDREAVLVLVERPLLREPSGRPLHPFGEPDGFGLVGEAPATWRLRERLDLVGKTPGHTLIVGPPGVGKRLCAAAISTAAPKSHQVQVEELSGVDERTFVDSDRTGTRIVAIASAEVETLDPGQTAPLVRRVPVPGLQARREDIPLLARHLLRRMADANPGLFEDGIPRLHPHLVRVLLRTEYSAHIQEMERMLWTAVEGWRLGGGGKYLDLDVPVPQR